MAALATSARLLQRGCVWLLDIDGTLVFTDDHYFKVFERLLSPLGYTVDQYFYRANVLGKVDHDVFSKLMPSGTSEDELRAMSRRKDALFCELYNEHAAAHGPPMVAGLREALALAQEHNVRCIAVTNAQRGAGEAAIASLRRTIPAASIIEGLVIGCECEHAKPAPDPYLEGMRQLGVRPEDCIVFEDSRSGVRSGVAAGVSAVVGLRTNMSHDELLAAGSTVTIADWTELTVGLVDKLMGSSAGSSPEA